MLLIAKILVSIAIVIMAIDAFLEKETQTVKTLEYILVGVFILIYLQLLNLYK